MRLARCLTKLGGACDDCAAGGQAHSRSRCERLRIRTPMPPRRCGRDVGADPRGWGLCVPVIAEPLPAKAVDRPVAGRGDDPSRRARWQSGGRPPPDRRGERVLDRLLGDVDVTEDADQDGHRATVLLAEHTLDLRGGQGRHAGYQPSGSSWNGRTSTGCVHARVALRPHASAESRSAALMIQNPPMCSLPSANGPSAVRRLDTHRPSRSIFRPGRKSARHLSRAGPPSRCFRARSSSASQG
jgi:hypothetical protein